MKRSHGNNYLIAALLILGEGARAGMDRIDMYWVV